MDLTTNLSLKKPAQADNYNVDDFNDNMDTLDAELGGHVAAAMPHFFTDGVTTYRWGLSVVAGVITLNYEEVV